MKGLKKPIKSEKKQITSSAVATYVKKTWIIYAMLLIPLLHTFIFRYVPMANIAMAFKDYNMFLGVWESPWSDPWYKWFQTAFSNRDFWLAFRNTLVLNLLDLALGFPVPIMLAILLNELAFKRYKRVTQTIIYLPHFLSWIIISGIAKQLFAPRTGVVNVLLGSWFGIGPIEFLTDNTLYVATYITLGIWKDMGWNTIIYLAAITGINTELYEAAEVDGASRLRKIWHITLPGIRSTIVILLIMSLGRLLGAEFDRPYAMMNDLVRSVADILSTLVYRVGIKGFQFSLTAAIGLFQSVIGVILLLTANAIAKRFGERGVL